MFRRLDDGWHDHLVALLERGIQQRIFRNNLNVPLCARAIMEALRGIGYQTKLPPRKVDELLTELAAQTEHWITAENAGQRRRRYLNYGKFIGTDRSIVRRTAACSRRQMVCGSVFIGARKPITLRQT
jgi:hypothetical protein